MPILQIILSVLLMTAGLYARSCCITLAERAFNTAIDYRAGTLITTIFIIVDKLTATDIDTHAAGVAFANRQSDSICIQLRNDC